MDHLDIAAAAVVTFDTLNHLQDSSSSFISLLAPHFRQDTFFIFLDDSALVHAYYEGCSHDDTKKK